MFSSLSSAMTVLIYAITTADCFSGLLEKHLSMQPICVSVEYIFDDYRELKDRDNIKILKPNEKETYKYSWIVVE